MNNIIIYKKQYISEKQFMSWFLLGSVSFSKKTCLKNKKKFFIMFPTLVGSKTPLLMNWHVINVWLKKALIKKIFLEMSKE